MSSEVSEQQRNGLGSGLSMLDTDFARISGTMRFADVPQLEPKDTPSVTIGVKPEMSTKTYRLEIT